MIDQIVKGWLRSLPGFGALWRLLAAFAPLGLLTYCGVALHAPLSTISLFYLLVVVVVALFWGFWLASLTSCLSVLCLDYFFTPPVLSFRVSNAHGYVALLVFEVTALIISTLSARALRHGKEAAVERMSMERLYELSRSALLLDLHQTPGPELVVLIHRIFAVRAVALFDENTGQLDKLGEWNHGTEEMALQSFLQNEAKNDENEEYLRRVLRIGDRTLGTLVVRGKLSALIMDAVASLTANAMERYETTQKENKAVSARQSEQLRTAVLDAMAHDFKTPLTAIQAASSGLIEQGGLTPPQSGMITLIDNEATLLNELCTRLLQMAKLDPEQFYMQKEAVNVPVLISEVLGNSLFDQDRNSIEIIVDMEIPTVNVTRELLTMVLSQYIDNARKYSTPGTPIEIVVRKSPSDLLVSVHNFGVPVRIEDRELIFERFYRSPDSKDAVAGTGIGLSAVKKAAEANYGHVWVISTEREGTTFFLSLPDADRRRN